MNKTSFTEIEWCIDSRCRLRQAAFALHAQRRLREMFTLGGLSLIALTALFLIR
jgi:hypothetical protein